MSTRKDIVFTSIPTEDKFYNIFKELSDKNETGYKHIKKLNEILLKEINSTKISNALKKMDWTSPTVVRTDEKGFEIDEHDKRKVDKSGKHIKVKKYTKEDYKEQLEKKFHEKNTDLIKNIIQSLYIVFTHTKKSESGRTRIPISEYVLEHDPKTVSIKVKSKRSKSGKEKTLRGVDFDSFKSIFTDPRVLDGIYRFITPSLKSITRYIINRSLVDKDVKEDARSKLDKIFESNDEKVYKHDYLKMYIDSLLKNIPKDYEKPMKKTTVKKTTVKKTKVKKSKKSMSESDEEEEEDKKPKKVRRRRK